MAESTGDEIGDVLLHLKARSSWFMVELKKDHSIKKHKKQLTVDVWMFPLCIERVGARPLQLSSLSALLWMCWLRPVGALESKRVGPLRFTGVSVRTG